MELLANRRKTRKTKRLINELTTSKEKIMSTIGRDFNKSVANINGLVSLLKDVTAADPDFETIQGYLSTETNKLQLLVKNICS